MRLSCCYAPDILEMLQADLVMLFFFNLLLDMLVYFGAQIYSFVWEQNGEGPTNILTRTLWSYIQEWRGFRCVPVILGSVES